MQKAQRGAGRSLADFHHLSRAAKTATPIMNTVEITAVFAAQFDISPFNFTSILNMAKTMTARAWLCYKRVIKILTME
ncbi:hypothetical protein CXQ82_16310 [Pseudomonas sp. S09G 359]|nr:hypothetical protein CXQ82_16310 [Pseudomonas sp. S09G 359]